MNLHLVRLPLKTPELLRFAALHQIPRDDDDLGYTLHAWLAALFGATALKPFRHRDRQRDVLAYSANDAGMLLEQARAFSTPETWAALDPAGVASKPMPEDWGLGRRLNIEVLACPVTRRDDGEKDVYLRALDRSEAEAPTRAETYKHWFTRQWRDAVDFESLAISGLQARSRLLRRDRRNGSRLRTIERPRAVFSGTVSIRQQDRFSELLARGIGRHRAFGFGMILLSPPR